MGNWLRNSFDKFYNFGGEPWGHPNTRPEIRTHYNWHKIGDAQVANAQSMSDTLGDVNGTSIVLVGAGFGWTGLGFENLGANVVGADISEYIQQEKNNTEEAEIREYIQAVGLDPDKDKIIGPSGKCDLDPLDFLMRGSRQAPLLRKGVEIVDENGATVNSWQSLVQQVNGTVDHIISEEVLNSIDDAEVLQLCEYLSIGAAQYNAEVTHILSPFQEGRRQAEGLNWKTYDDWRIFLDTNGFANHRIMPSVGTQGRNRLGELF